MIAHQSLLIEPALKAGIKVPEDVARYNKKNYPHWEVYLASQLGQSMPTPDAHWENAKVVAAVPMDEITTITFDELVELGFKVGKS